MTQLATIGCVVGLAVAWMFLVVFAASAAIMSSNISESEREADAAVNWDYPADGPDGSVNSDGSECDHG